LGEDGQRFNSATDAEILNAEVADSYFHRTMEILRSRGLEDTSVHAELAYKTSDPDAWFVVAGLTRSRTSSRTCRSR
jgi:nicotinate phosphoribosyltransferase